MQSNYLMNISKMMLLRIIDFIIYHYYCKNISKLYVKKLGQKIIIKLFLTLSR